MTTKRQTNISTEQLTVEIQSTIEVYRDIEGQEPDAINVMDALCDDARKAGFRFDEPTARTLISAMISKSRLRTRR